MDVVINLISTIKTQNDIGNTIETETLKTIFANKKSITQTEFYQAQSTGLKPEIKFVIRTVEYNDETQLQYNSKNYNIIRTYEAGEFLELICNNIVGDR